MPKALGPISRDRLPGVGGGVCVRVHQQDLIIRYSYQWQQDLACFDLDNHGFGHSYFCQLNKLKRDLARLVR